MGGSVHDSSYVALARISYVVPLVFWGWESGYLLMKEHRGGSKYWKLELIRSMDVRLAHF